MARDPADTPALPDTPAPAAPVAKAGDEKVNVRITKAGDGKVSTGEYDAENNCDAYYKKGAVVTLARSIATDLEDRGFVEIQ